jgi:hypothetical protein
MHHTPRTFLLVLPLVVAACTTAGGARRAELRRGLDEARLSRSPAEIWPEVERFLHERGYPLVGADRTAVGLKPQGAFGKLFSPGFETVVREDGSRVLETNPEEQTRSRIRAEAFAAAGGGARLRLRILKPSPSNPTEYSEWRDEELELALLRRIEPAVAARIAGEAPPAAAPASAGAGTGAPTPGTAPSAAPTSDRWAPVRHLVGSWAGTIPGGATVQWRFDFVQTGRFIEVRGSPMLFAGTAAAAAPGEELGRISQAGDRLLWHQFTNGGQVDVYRSEPARPGGLVFLSESPGSFPAGTRIRLTLDGDRELLATLELAEPGKDFAAVGVVRLHRERER